MLETLQANERISSSSPSYSHHYEWFIRLSFANNKNILKQTKRSIWRMNLSQCLSFFPFILRARWISLNRRFHFIRNYSIKFLPSTSSWAKQRCFCFLCFLIFHALEEEEKNLRNEFSEHISESFHHGKQKINFKQIE